MIEFSKKNIKLVVLISIIVLIFIKITTNVDNTNINREFTNNSIKKNVKIDNNFLENFFNEENCDQILNKNYYLNCYDYDFKSSKYVHYTLEKDLVNKSIKERPRFYEDLDIPIQYRTRHSDYTNTGFDKGHILSDASMDHSVESQLSTYTMSNIIPQLPEVNRSKNSWLGIEIYEREITNKYKNINVLNFIIFEENPKRIGKSQLAIPFGFGKVIYNQEMNFLECFFVENKIPTNENFIELKIDCEKIGIMN